MCALPASKKPSFLAHVSGPLQGARSRLPCLADPSESLLHQHLCKNLQHELHSCHHTEFHKTLMLVLEQHAPLTQVFLLWTLREQAGHQQMQKALAL